MGTYMQLVCTSCKKESGDMVKVTTEWTPNIDSAKDVVAFLLKHFDSCGEGTVVFVLEYNEILANCNFDDDADAWHKKKIKWRG